MSQERLLQRIRDPARTLPDAVWRQADAAVRRRGQGEPVAYIVGSKEFWGLTFAVDARTLVPRPDSELLVERAALRLLDRDATAHRVIDCCSGSGCIGIALAHELAGRGRSVQLWLSDSDPRALEVARDNAARLLGNTESVRWRTVRSDLLSGIRQTAIDCIVANPPYLTTAQARRALRRHGWGEPPAALDGGSTGLTLYPRLARGALDRLAAGGYIIVECGDDQTATIAAMFRATGYRSVRELCDLAAKPRAVEAQVR